MTRTRARWARRRFRRPVTLLVVALATLVPSAAPVDAVHDPLARHRASAAQDGRIYFVDGSTGQITSTTAGGSGRKSLKGPGHSPAVSPDGTRIAFESSTGRGIDLENVDGTGRQVLVPDAGGMPTWSPDGSQIAYTVDGDIAVVTVATKAVTLLTDDGTTTEEVAPAWSPTNTLAYSSGGCNGGGINIWSMSAAGKAKTDLTCDPSAYNSDTSPSYAPSGDRIAFVSDERVDKDYDQLYVMNPDGTGITYVDTGSRFGLADPDWAVTPAAQSTALTLSAAPSTVASGQPVKLSGTLTPVSGQGYAGQKVVLMAEPSGSTTYSPVKTVRTAADGTWKTTLSPTTTTSYEATYAANPTLGFAGSSSPARTVTVD